MRTTVINRLDAERLEPYDPDYHALLERQLDLDVLFEDTTGSNLHVRFDLAIAFIDPDDRKIGRIDLEATCKLNDLDDVPRDEDDEILIDELPEHVLRLIEGGLAEDALLPASHLARSMRLPSILPIPRLFERQPPPED